MFRLFSKIPKGLDPVANIYKQVLYSSSIFYCHQTAFAFAILYLIFHIAYFSMLLPMALPWSNKQKMQLAARRLVYKFSIHQSMALAFSYEFAEFLLQFSRMSKVSFHSSVLLDRRWTLNSHALLVSFCSRLKMILHSSVLIQNQLSTQWESSNSSYWINKAEENKLRFWNVLD